MRHPIFVVGMPRSGTTLFSSMLNAHPDIAISPETHFYTRCRAPEARRPQAMGEVWTCLQQQPGFRDMAFTDEERRRIQERIQAGPAAPAEVLRAVETTYAERTEATAWGEKTPDHLPHVPTMLQDFPEAVVVAIVRDPRDVCLSLRGMPWNYDALPESALKWRRYARLTERFRRAHPNHVREVQYEALLADPEREIRRVLDWMGAPFDSSVLAFHRREDGPADPEREPWKKKAHQSIDPENKEKWRDRMTPGERVVVEAIAGPMMTEKHYATPPVALTSALLVDLVRVLGRALSTIGHRLWRRWRLAGSGGETYTPGWIRVREGDAEDGRVENGDEREDQPEA